MAVDTDNLRRRIVAALPQCNELELQALTRMVTCIEQRRTIQALRELRDAATYTPGPRES